MLLVAVAYRAKAFYKRERELFLVLSYESSTKDTSLGHDATMQSSGRVLGVL